MTRAEAIELQSLERKHGKMLDTILKRGLEETISRQFELNFENRFERAKEAKT